MYKIISKIHYAFGYINGALSTLPYIILSYILYGLEMVWCFLSKEQKTKWLNDMKRYDEDMSGKDIRTCNFESMFGKWCIFIVNKILEF